MRLHTLAFGVLVAVTATPALAAVPDLYVTVVASETIDGEPAKSTRGGTTLLQGLTEAGFHVVDPAGLKGLASVTDGKELAGRFTQVDWILQMTVDSNKLGEGVMGTSFVRYEAGVEAKLFASDTGEVIKAFNIKGQGMDLQPRAAALMASEQGAKALAKTLAKQAHELLRQDARITLSVSGIPDAGEMDRMVTALKELSGVKGVSARGYEKKQGQFMVDLTGVSTSEMATAIDAAKGLGITVDGYSLRRIGGRYDPNKMVRISVLIGPLHNGTGFDDADWLSTTIPKVLRMEWSNLRSLDVEVAGTDRGLPTRLEDVTGFLKGKPELGTMLYCGGKYGFKGGKAVVHLNVFRVDNARSIAAIKAKGPVKEFRSVVMSSGAKLAKKTVKAVAGDRKLRKLAGAAFLKGKAAAALAEADVRRFLQQVRLLPQPDKEHLKGEVVLGGRAPSEAALWLRVPGAMKEAVRQDVPEAGGKVAPFDLKLKGEEGDAMSLEVELRYRADGAWHQERMVHPVVMAPGGGGEWLSAD